MRRATDHVNRLTQNFNKTYLIYWCIVQIMREANYVVSYVTVASNDDNKEVSNVITQALNDVT